MRRKTITLIVTVVLGAVGLTIAGQASAERAPQRLGHVHGG